jgi:hypothetical protein
VPVSLSHTHTHTCSRYVPISFSMRLPFWSAYWLDPDDGGRVVYRNVGFGRTVAWVMTRKWFNERYIAEMFSSVSSVTKILLTFGDSNQRPSPRWLCISICLTEGQSSAWRDVFFWVYSFQIFFDL